jgi:peptide/nickel transport system substrate-binding protein
MRTRTPLARTATAVAVAAGLVIGLGACSSGSGSSSGVTLTVAGQSDNLTRVFNPFLPNTAEGLTFAPQSGPGFIYEPLVQINTANIGHDIPWLAKKWEWSNGNKTLTLHLASGVTWSDGKPFSAKDVAFTYDMLKKNPALNSGGVDFQSIAAQGDDTVVLQFAQPAEQNFTTLVSVPIVPEHIWSKVANPTTYQDANPIGTGAFTLSTFSPQSFLLTKNTHYWNGEPKISGLRFVAFKDNQSQTNALVQGQADWGGTFIPDAQKSYTSKNADYHYWAPLAGTDGLIPNLAKWPLSDIAVRRAISLGVDRDQVAKATNDVPATNVSGLPIPTYKDSISPALQHRSYKQDTAAAARTLTAAGYVKGGDGYYTKNGKRLEFSISFPSSFTDIASRAQVLVSQLKTLGMKLDIDTTSANDINKDTASGDFESTMGYPVGPQPTAFSLYDSTINPNDYVPVGKSTPAFENIERFQDPKAAALFTEYPLAATAADRQHILDQLQQIFADQLPWIPMFYWGNYSEWSSSKVTGWPSPTSPYFTAVPNEVVALRLKPVK